MDTSRTQLDTAWTQLGHSWTQPDTAGHTSDTAHHDPTRVTRSSGESMGSQTCPASPTAPERGAGLEGHGQAWVRQLTGQHQEPLRGSITGSTRVAPCSPIHTPGPTRGQRTRLGPNITALLGPCQAGFYALTKKLPINDKSPGFCPTLKPSAGALGAGQGSCTRQEVPGLLSGRQPGLCSPGPL